MLRFLGFLVILGVIFVGVGAWRGWIDLSFNSEGDSGKKSLSIGLDKDKLGEDVDLVKDKIAKVTTGAIESVDAATKTVKLKTPAGVVEVPVDDTTTIELDGEKIKLTDLKPGDDLKISWHEVDGKKIASGITVTRN